MIKKFDFIKDFGIFKDINSNEIQDFNKYNLIYGWNGSGKSTFSRLFYSLKTKIIVDNHKDCSFKLTLDDNSNIESKTINKIDDNLKIEVFNDEFVRDNIDWDNITKKLLYISEAKVEEKKKLTILENEYRNLEIDINLLENGIEKINQENQKFLTDGAREIKKQFEVLSTDDRYYLNYDKRNLEKIALGNSSVKKAKLIAKLKDIESLKLTARLDYLEKIDKDLPIKVENDKLVHLQAEINEVLTKNIVSKAIDSIKNNSKSSTWIEKGLEIHENSKKCKFCNNRIAEDRIKELNSHFNHDYIETKTKIKGLIIKLKAFEEAIVASSIPKIEIFPFLKNSFEIEINKYLYLIEDIQLDIKKGLTIINQKFDNPFYIPSENVTFNLALFNSYNECLDSINKIIVSHNSTSDDFENHVSSAKKKLELSFAQKELKNYKFYSKLKLKKVKEKSLKPLEDKLPILSKKIELLNASLSDEILGAEEFNNKLHRFLNHSDISLKYDSTKKGYLILRKIGRKKLQATNLSEGEKTAISFIYYLTKLLENEGDLKETIVVIDDPISSFDSNHLFNAYSFVINICNEAKQLFVLTHNFTFYRLVRDWMLKKEKWKNRPDGTRFLDKKYCVYSISSNYKDGIRQSKIVNAESTLLDYSTEYHFLFSKLHKFNTSKKLSIEECFFVANVSRKLLEIFLSFKFPKKRNNFALHLNSALPNKSDAIMRERVYRFINKYSHTDYIEAFDNSIDNIISESDNIAKDVIKIIKKLDKKHYEELIEIVA